MSWEGSVPLWEQRCLGIGCGVQELLRCRNKAAEVQLLELSGSDRRSPLCLVRPPRSLARGGDNNVGAGRNIQRAWASLTSCRPAQRDQSVLAGGAAHADVQAGWLPGPALASCRGGGERGRLVGQRQKNGGDRQCVSVNGLAGSKKVRSGDLHNASSVNLHRSRQWHKVCTDITNWPHLGAQPRTARLEGARSWWLAAACRR